MNITITNYYNY